MTSLRESEELYVDPDKELEEQKKRQTQSLDE